MIPHLNLTTDAPLDILGFILAGIFLTGYVLLDGFDLGVGILRLFVKDEQDKRTMLRAIEPTWDAAELWLIAAAAVLVVAFPEVESSVLSGFYLALKLWLLAIVIRIVAIESRNRLSEAWHRTCDGFLGVASICSAFLIGAMVGALVWGVPLDEEHEFSETLHLMVNPCSILFGFTTLSLFIMHGTLFLVMKTDGALQKKARTWIRPAITVFAVIYAVATFITPVFIPHMVLPLEAHPGLILLPIVTVLALANIVRQVYLRRNLAAFLSSCTVIVGLSSLFGVGMFPNLVISLSPENTLTIFNAVNARKIMTALTILGGLGIPFVVAYTACAYWIFRGKVQPEDTRLKHASPALPENTDTGRHESKGCMHQLRRQRRPAFLRYFHRLQSLFTPPQT